MRKELKEAFVETYKLYLKLFYIGSYVFIPLGLIVYASVKIHFLFWAALIPYSFMLCVFIIYYLAKEHWWDL